MKYKCCQHAHSARRNDGKLAVICLRLDPSNWPDFFPKTKVYLSNRCQAFSGHKSRLGVHLHRHRTGGRPNNDGGKIAHCKYHVKSVIQCKHTTFVFRQDWGNEKLVRTQKQVERNPYDLEAWSILLREAQSKHISEVRALYEHLIGIFPSASRYWRIYIEHEVGCTIHNLIT